MRQGQQNRNNRQRNRGRRQNNNSANKVYDSNGPDVRVRGSAQTVADKYLQLAADAQSQGDKITAESYFQHAEHYLRIVASIQAQREQRQAEKEKAANAARAKNKKAENTDADNERQASDSPKNLDKDNGPSGTGDNDSNWEGPQPAFLKTSDAEADEKSKTTGSAKRRKPKKETSDLSEASSDIVVETGAS